MSTRGKKRKVIPWIWPPESAKEAKPKAVKPKVTYYSSAYDYDDWDYGDGYGKGYEWRGKSDYYEGYKYVPLPPPKKYPVFMLDPTNKYRKYANGKFMEEIVADEMPNDTMDYEFHQVYIRRDNQEELILKDAEAGAMWFAPWLDGLYRPQLEHVLVIRLPYGVDFMPDAKADNCRNHLDWKEADDLAKARKEGKKVISSDQLAKEGHKDGADYSKEPAHWWSKWWYDEPIEEDHHCWLIHGELPNITIDKRGHTCSAGAGSISSGRWGEGNHWHGFLTNGVLQ